VSGFPPRPASFRGRARELATLASLVRARHPTIVALVGGGGSGKTTLAAALGHRLDRAFGGRRSWLRIGAWDASTVAKMMALQLAAGGRGAAIDRVRRALRARGDSLVVLDNHESDAVTAEVLDALRGAPVSWVITARRCLLGGVTVFPIVPPLIGVRRDPFPAIARLTPLLRWHPVALDVADAIVAARLASVGELERRLRARGVHRIRPVEHEDDVPEVRAIVAEASRHLPPAARRMLGILAAMGGDAMDEASLVALARAGRTGARAVGALLELRLVQRPAAGRLTLHATVRYAVRRASAVDEDAVARHYLALLERHPGRLEAEQTHLFALMDWAQERGDLGTILRVQELAERLDRL
jgi:hypothetical protein